MLKFSDTVEESIRGGLACEGDGYYMDETDKAWLDAHNAQAAAAGPSGVHAVPTPTRRALKGKGKEIEPCMGPPCPITEDEMELVMGFMERRCCRAHPHLNIVSISHFVRLPVFPFSFILSPLVACRVVATCRDFF